LFTTGYKRLAEENTRLFDEGRLLDGGVLAEGKLLEGDC
jgi:hypothetical protein